VRKNKYIINKEYCKSFIIDRYYYNRLNLDKEQCKTTLEIVADPTNDVVRAYISDGFIYVVFQRHEFGVASYIIDDIEQYNKFTQPFDREKKLKRILYENLTK
jgi:hypothetical protein